MFAIHADCCCFCPLALLHSDVSLILAATSCSVSALRRLGEIDSPTLVSRVLKITRSGSDVLHDASLHLLLTLLNMSSVPDNQARVVLHSVCTCVPLYHDVCASAACGLSQVCVYVLHTCCVGWEIVHAVCTHGPMYVFFVCYACVTLFIQVLCTLCELPVAG